MYEMPFGLVFRKAVLWHEGEEARVQNLQEIKRDPASIGLEFCCFHQRMDVSWKQLSMALGLSIHRLPYVKTDCSGSFEVTNNSLARAVLRLERGGRATETLETSTGAVLEMVGR